VSETKILHFGKPSEEVNRLTPTTCTEAETFALQVLDKSMEPEFRERSIIVVDPTGHATDGSYVLAQTSVNRDSTADADEPDKLLSSFLFRQLRRRNDSEWILCALNTTFEDQPTAADLSEIVGVIVQRAGTRRRYHKRYD